MGTITLSKLQKCALGKVFVETGCQEGWTLLVAKEFGFSEIHSIELDDELYLFSKNRFITDNTIHIHHGDSGDVLKYIMPTLVEPATIWLDAHTSNPDNGRFLPGGIYGGSPLLVELAAVMLSPCKDHVIMIDDVRLFGSSDWDFLDKEKVIEMIYQINTNYTISYIDGEDNGDFPGDIMVASVVKNA